MIKELSEAFRRLVNSLSVRPVATLTAVFIIAMSYVAYKSYNTLETLVITPSEEAARFKNQLESSKLVNQSIEYLREDLKAHSVIIKQFHNGRHDLTGIPFTEATSTYYTESYETADSNEPISSMNNSLQKMWGDIQNPKCTVLNSAVDASSRRYFKTYGLTKVVECPLTNLLNYPIGVILVGFSESNTSDEVAVSKTSAIAKRVTGYLDNGY